MLKRKGFQILVVMMVGASIVSSVHVAHAATVQHSHVGSQTDISTFSQDREQGTVKK